MSEDPGVQFMGARSKVSCLPPPISVGQSSEGISQLTNLSLSELAAKCHTSPPKGAIAPGIAISTPHLLSARTPHLPFCHP